jgi:hypothetical protein
MPSPQPEDHLVELTESRKIRFHYLKSQLFRSMHVDGAIGGLSPNGQNIHISVYSEQLPLPTVVINEIDPDGKLGGEIKRIARDGVVREVEADLVLSLDSARALMEWLGRTINESEVTLRNLAKAPQ